MKGLRKWRWRPQPSDSFFYQRYIETGGGGGRRRWRREAIIETWKRKKKMDVRRMYRS